jgi:hypothetical protein
MSDPVSARDGTSPSTAVLILRFPDGDVEHRTTQGELPIGALVKARGTTWRVKSYSHQSAILETEAQGDGATRDGDGDGAAGGPIVVPHPLGDKPLTLEILRDAWRCGGAWRRLVVAVDDEVFQTLLEQMRGPHRRTDEITRSKGRVHENVRARLSWKDPPSLPAEQRELANEVVEALDSPRLSTMQLRQLWRTYVGE